jgi:hypothetical protein
LSDPDIFDVVIRLAQQTEVPAHEAPKASHQPPHVTEDSAFFPSMTSAKERKTPDELAAMILADLSEVKGCPKHGVKIVVYGLSPWNTWLSFGTDAGPVPNKAELQDFLEIIAGRLKRLYDIAY